MPKSRGRKRGALATPLEGHRREGKILRTPMNQLGGMSLSSWANEVLPDMLWALLLLKAMTRTECLEQFKLLLAHIEENQAAFENRNLGHASLAQIDGLQFEQLFSALCADKDVGPALAPLLVLEELPGKDRWGKLLTSIDKPWDKLAETVAVSYDHQSQIATDCRWLRAMTEIKKGKVVFSSEVSKAADRIMTFADKDDHQSAGSAVRSFEMMTRQGELHEGAKTWSNQFWSYAFIKTSCSPVNPEEAQGDSETAKVADVIQNVHEELSKHYLNTITTTDVDARHEGSFGLAFYILHLGYLTLMATIGRTVQGRLTLRSAVEALVILMYLAKKDDNTIWLQYRNYGASQAKLALLKYKEEDAPSYVTRNMLEEMANADFWMEYQDIKLGAWADKNLRRMSEEADAKALYDKHYDSLSGYTHANWSAVSHSTFGLCLNPLHRFHRFPLPPRFFSQDAAPDMIKIINQALDQITKLYPPFKPRISVTATSLQ